MTFAIPTYNKMILKARADEAKATIQAIAFAQERYHQETGSFYPNSDDTIKNENIISSNLKVSLYKSNNFLYTITGTDGTSYTIKAILRSSNWDECGTNTTISYVCKQNDTQDSSSWIESYSSSISIDSHYLEYKYPTILDNAYTEEGISYQNLYKGKEELAAIEN